MSVPFKKKNDSISRLSLFTFIEIPLQGIVIYKIVSIYLSNKNFLEKRKLKYQINVICK